MRKRAGLELRRVPNILSLSRVLLAILFVPAGRGGRIALICLAGATDFLDGWIARRTNSSTRWGALVDPIADRIFVLVAIVVYVLDGRLSVLQALLLLTRDVATAVGFFVARIAPRLRSMEFKARFPGKIVTVLQLVALIAVAVGMEPLMPLLILVALASAIAILDYTVALWRARAR